MFNMSTEEEKYCFVGVQGPGIVVDTVEETRQVIDNNTSLKGIFINVLIEGLSQFIRELKEDIRMQDIPIAVVGSNDPIFYELGADECYRVDTSGCNFEISEEVLSDLEIRRFQKQQKLLDANIDCLTGCYNRKYFDMALYSVFSKGSANCSLLLIDIDDFKKVNDRHGHQCGDHVLQELGSFLRERVRSSDIVCRYGGEEFAIILSDLSLKEASKIANRLRQHWQENFVLYNDLKITTTISGGIGFTHDNVNTPEELIEKADKALYRSKQNGKNQIQKDGDRLMPYYRF